MRRNGKIIKRHILYFTVICLFVIITSLLGIKCPFTYLFRVPCPTCGVTRAMVSLFKFNIEGYFYYHPLAIPLILSVLLMIHEKCFKRKWAIYSFAALTLTANLCLYAVRLAHQ